MKILRYRSTAGETLFAREHADGVRTKLTGHLFGDLQDTGVTADIAKILSPVAPVNILCTGLNYGQHAAETNSPLPSFPVLFMKLASAVQNPGDPIVLPRWLPSQKVDYECELAIIIGQTCKNVSRAQALDYVLGYTCANDVSARDWQKEGGGGQWCRGKTFDTFCPLGPCLVTQDEIVNPSGLRLRTLVNGETLQDSSTSDLIFDVPTLIEFYSGSTTLTPGTVILTGTPQGVGMARKPPRWLQPGDNVTIEIEKIGALTNPVVAEEAAGGSQFKL
jgi:2-keto-4-pentenoate hydratase/2-oxohepta-3-ene-1,7-dioic acid hydratase in catechol pathway